MPREGTTVSVNLDKYSRDTTGLARQRKLDPFTGRPAEIETVIEIQGRREKNAPGHGRPAQRRQAAIVQRLAQRIVNGEV